MNVPNWMRLSLKPDFVIGDNYLRRWWIVPRNKLFNVYLHRILKSDDDRALHDHPWLNISVVIRGGYWEHRRVRGRVVETWRRPGSLVFRKPTAAHRLEVEDGTSALTLFITGPRVRSWGFHCPQGWVHWRLFTDPSDEGKVGRGCDQDGEILLETTQTVV